MIATTLLITVFQQTTLAGVVRDSVDLEPVAFAEVTVAGVNGEPVTAPAISDRFGAFVVPGVPVAVPVRVDVVAFGYAVWARTYDSLPSGPRSTWCCIPHRSDSRGLT